MATINQNYLSLSTEAQHLLQLCAVYHQGINRTELVELSRMSGWKDDGGRLLDYKQVRSEISSLERNRLFLKHGSKLVVNPDVEDFVVQESVRHGEFERLAKTVQETAPSTYYYTSYGDSTRTRWIRDLRIAFYRGDGNAFKSLASVRDVSLVSGDPSIDVLQSFDRQIFDMLDPLLQDMYLKEATEFAFTAAYGNSELIATIREQARSKKKLDDDQFACLLNVLIAAGDFDGLRELDKQSRGEAPEVQASIAVLRGQWDVALAGFNKAHARLRKKTRKRNVALPNLIGFLHAYLLLRENSTSARNRVQAITKSIEASDPRDLLSHAASTVKHAAEYQAHPTNDSVVVSSPPSTECPPWCHLTAVYLWQWLNPEEDDIARVSVLQKATTQYRDLGFYWLAAEAAAAASKLESKQATKLAQQAVQAHKELGTASLMQLIAPEPIWARTLSALAQVGQVKTSGNDASDSSTESLERMIWEVELYGTQLDLTPLIQKRSKSGAWTKGRKVAVERLYAPKRNDDDFDFLTDADRDICACIHEDYSYSGYGRYRDTDYDFEMDKVAPRLVGHPLVFRRGQREQPIEIELREPQLVVKKMKGGKLRLSLEPKPGDDAGVTVIEEGPHRLVVIRYTKDHQRLWEIIGDRLEVPALAKEQVLQTMGSVASLVTIHSEVGGVAGDVGETVAGDPSPHLHLLPYQQGVRAEFFVRPFDGDGPSYRPAQGGTNVFAEVDGNKKCAERDFTAELKAVQNVISAIPALQELTGEIKTNGSTRNGSSITAALADLAFPTPIEALELMLALRPVTEAGQVTLHWPQGKAFNVVGQADLSQFRMNIRRDRDWFAASGKLKVDGKLTLDMMKLVELVEASPSRFIEIEEGKFIALTERFRRRIEDLVAFSDRQKKKLRFPAIRAAALEDLGDDIQLNADEHWTEAVSRIRDAAEFQAKQPSTFQGELRDYQQEGFSWLARLAHWGVGACLADDMGLGKTIQAIALLLDRAGGGPALVVAPTSVGFNWRKEIARFAPTLNPTLVSEADRAAMFDNLGPRDVVICSYGLLHHEAERLQSQPWHTVILDEAQAIKNTATKRSQAAMKLDAGFRLIMTGTPLENHLGELWNLMQFINPGLLGSLEMFNKRFAIPIERDQCRATRQRLKKLIQPFILRRTKTQVLDELPSRTEITLQVDLSDEEAAFYEALRMRAVEKLADSDDKKPQHLKILAEIMRLRRACCHPRLVMPESNVSSSKLDLFSDTIDELLDGGHKVLVFSQFVGHLSILREELDRKGVSYQYLDGSTPARQREKSVEAFQAGEGDVFLISLRAGGLGLNLTAADYVIHMDPWWNPAVEDQASDRAHRLGQTRPVTIYRFVTQGTIEERIVALHRTKRDLADSLLEGTDMSGKLSADELLKLLSE